MSEPLTADEIEGLREWAGSHPGEGDALACGSTSQTLALRLVASLTDECSCDIDGVCGFRARIAELTRERDEAREEYRKAFGVDLGRPVCFARVPTDFYSTALDWRERAEAAESELSRLRALPYRMWVEWSKACAHAYDLEAGIRWARRWLRREIGGAK